MSPSKITEKLPKPNVGQRRLFLKAGCPFCTKLVVFISASGLLEKFKPIYDCPPVREYVSSVNEGKISFPALEMEEDKVVMLETTDIINLLIKENNIKEEELWSYHYFEGGLLKSYSALFGYLVKNEGGYPQARKWFAEQSDIVQQLCPPEGAVEVL